jgi:predicted permease
VSASSLVIPTVLFFATVIILDRNSQVCFDNLMILTGLEKSPESKRPVWLLVMAAFLCCFMGFIIFGVVLYRWFKGEGTLPQGVATVPVFFYKDALALVDRVVFGLLPAFGVGYLLVATIIWFYIYKSRKLDKHDQGAA